MPHTTRPVYHNHHRSTAEALLEGYRDQLHALTQIVDGVDYTVADQQRTVAQFRDCQAHLIQVLIAGLQTGLFPT